MSLRKCEKLIAPKIVKRVWYGVETVLHGSCSKFAVCEAPETQYPTS